MDTTADQFKRVIEPPGRSRFSLTLTQVLLLGGLLVVGLPCLLFTVEAGLANTLLIYLFVMFVGLGVCHATQRDLGDRGLKALQTFWLIKLGATLSLLYFGWIPQLDPAMSPAWGYDPQRYFYDAYDLIENGWNPLVSSNYQGVLFYYAGLFYVFGHNPVIPALVNAFVTLLVTLYLIRLAYEFKVTRGPRDWCIAWLLLIPEVLWYDSITSRETLAAALILFAMLPAGRYIVRSAKVSLVTTIIIVGGALGGILAVRTTMAFAVVGAIAVMALMLRSQRKMGALGKLPMLVLVVALLLAGPWVQEALGGYVLNYARLLQGLQSFEDNVAAVSEWSENSLGLLLSPDTPWEAFVFTPPRMILYLAAPLPNIGVTAHALAAGSWSAWQQLMTVASSVLNLVAIPFLLAGLEFAWVRRRAQPGPLVLYIAFWITFVAIGGGNVIIHERYRIMMTPLLFACAWFGYVSCPPARVRDYFYAWGSMLVLGAVFFLVYKFL